MKKKVISISIIVITILGLLMAILLNTVTYGYEENIDGLTWYYQKSNNKAFGVYLKSGTPGETLTIPSTLGGATVVGISGANTSTSYKNRFNILNQKNENTTIKKVVIPETVTNIDNNTFANFCGLTEINIPSGVTSIGAYAYYNCSGATNELIIPDSVVAIYQSAFDNCRNISGIIIGNGIKDINSYVFSSCSNAKTVKLGNNVKTINTYAFNYCTKIEGTLTLPDSVTSVASSAFSSYCDIEKIEIGKGLSTIPTELLEGRKIKEFVVSENNPAYLTEDGILFNKNKTSIVRYPALKEMENYIMPDTVNKIESSAFYNTSLLKSVTFSENLISIGTRSFTNSAITGNLVIPNSVTTINSNAFDSCKNITSLTLGSNISTIGESAFYNCTGLKGDLNIHDSITTLGSSAFENCTGLDGNLTIGTGLSNIQYSTFRGDKNFKKAKIGSGVTSIGSYAFEGFSDIWVDNISANVSVSERAGGDLENPFIHWLDDTHKLTISVVPGVKLINNDTNEVINSGDYMCETSFDYKIKIDEGYNYSNLKIIEVNNNDTENFKSVDVDESTTYKFDSLIRDRNIYVQNLSEGLDLSLRTFITEINRTNISQSRYPVVNITNGNFEYMHTKYPVNVKTGDLVTYKIRVYNEGITSGIAKKVNLYIPEGLQYETSNKTNIDNNWVNENEQKISTTYLSNQEIKGYNGNGVVNYKDIEVVLKVTKEKSNDENIRLNLIAEIAEESENDADSTPGSISSAVSSNYKEEESYNSTTSSYIKGQEDDDDFESVVLAGKIKVDYGLRINKIDTDTKELLSGAKFNLLNENEEVIKVQETDENGALDFGTITTYGEGEDVYYIEEAETPKGYISIQKSKIKITVVKTIIDENLGTYSVKVMCDLLDYNVDTTRYEYTPIKTAEQLQKIGSGETITIDGVNYEYKIDTNYKLMNDIDLSGINWTPISNEMKCIIDGNNHKISNLTITSDGESDISEIGLFKVFSGIVENLEFENVTITIPSFATNAVSQSGYTGVGAIAGVMKEGYIINCKVSGNITSANDNIGGFVGHTISGKMVKVQNCTNNSNVVGTTGSNVGGIIGCALGAISFSDCTNNGSITCDKYNSGGLVGYAKASDYTEVDINADFNEQDKVIDLVVENKSTKGQYSVVLENIDGKTSGLVSGATYKILDKNKNPIQGLENVTLTNGTLNLKTVDIETLGVDTYYIKELTPANGYEKLNAYIKINVRRYWDNQTARFKVSIEKEALTDEELEKDIPDQTEDKLPSKTGETFTKVNFANVSWNSNKAEFKDCTNNGQILAKYMNAGGIIGTSHCITEISDCENKGTTNSDDKAGGIISELKTQDKMNVYSKFKNCINSGKVSAGGENSIHSSGSAGGIIANAIGSLKVTDCNNLVEVTSIYSRASAGIVGDANGQIIVTNCKNEGKISAKQGDINTVAGGIIGKNYWSSYTETNKEQSIVKIYNCQNNADITSEREVGGIIGISTANILEIENCKTNGIDSENKVNIIDTNAGAKGGIIGHCRNNSVSIKNCDVENVNFERASSINNKNYGATAGIIGEVYNENEVMNKLEVMNCRIQNCKISTFGKETAGVIGTIFSYDKNINNCSISDCYVNNCEILHDKATDTKGSSAGILAMTYGVKEINIKNCEVNNSSVTSNIVENSSGYNMNVGGIIAFCGYTDNIEINNCDVKNTQINNNCYNRDSYANIAGIIAVAYKGWGSQIGITISNSNLINSNLFTKSGNAGGIIAYADDNPTNTGKIVNCKVEKSTINSEAGKEDAYDNNSNTAGIIATAVQPLEIEKCKVMDSEISGWGSNTAGILGSTTGNNVLNKLNECVVNNNNIESKRKFTGNYSNNNVGGLIAFANKVELNNCIVEKGNDKGLVKGVGAQISGGVAAGIYIEANNCSIKGINVENGTDVLTSSGTYRTISGFLGAGSGKLQNISVENVNISGVSEVAGGIFAYMNNADQIENCLVKNLNIKQRNNGEESIANGAYEGSIGGIGGILENSSNPVKNNKVLNSTIDIGIKIGGGLIGTTVSDVTIDNCNVDNVTLNNPNIGYRQSANESTQVTMGGLIGISSNIVIKNESVVKNSNIKINEGIGKPGLTGGLIGFSSGDAVIELSNVYNTNIINNTPQGITGGIVGMMNYAKYTSGTVVKTLNISNVSIENCENISGKNHVGGVLGFGKIIAKDITISDNTIKGLGENGDIGGIVGNSLVESIIDKATITNTNISGEFRAGGICGYNEAKITNSNISNSAIKATNSEAGGIVGNVSIESATIKDCNVDKTEISNVNGSIGGIAGLAKVIVDNCYVSNSSITATGESSTGVGGIVGSGGENIAIKNSTVENNTLSGADEVGDIIGTPNIEPEDCIVKTLNNSNEGSQVTLTSMQNESIETNIENNTNNNEQQKTNENNKSEEKEESDKKEETDEKVETKENEKETEENEKEENKKETKEEIEKADTKTEDKKEEKNSTEETKENNENKTEELKNDVVKNNNENQLENTKKEA